jgi:DNA-binding GntR family transcriptional regulator
MNVNKQERTYTILRDRIHSGSIAPLERLKIDALARELGVSPIPVREALRRLEAEGWVRFTPNVGAVVSPVDSTSWEQSMVVLAILEGAASGEARAHLRRSDLTRLRRIATAMEDAAARADPLRFSKLNRSLHQTIIDRCANTYLIELLEQANARLDRVRSTMFVYLPHRSEEALREHVHLIELLAEGTKDEVEAYARWHKLQTVEAYRAIHQANDKVRAARAPSNGTAVRSPRTRSVANSASSLGASSATGS